MNALLYLLEAFPDPSMTNYAGAFMVAPLINPYEPGMTNEERRRTWNKWTVKRKLMYFLSRRFPRFLPYFYRKSFLSANVGQRDKWLSLSLGKRVRKPCIYFPAKILI